MPRSSKLDDTKHIPVKARIRWLQTTPEQFHAPSPTSASLGDSRKAAPDAVHRLLGVTHVGLWCHGNSVDDLPHGRDVVITLGHLLRDANLQLKNLLIFAL